MLFTSLVISIFMVYHSFTFAIPVSILHSLFLVSGFDNQMTPGSDSDRQAPFGIGKVAVTKASNFASVLATSFDREVALLTMKNNTVSSQKLK